DDVGQLVLLPKLLELGIVERVELEPLREVALDEGKHINLLHGRLAAAEVKHRAFLEVLGEKREDDEMDHFPSFRSFPQAIKMHREGPELIDESSVVGHD